MRKYSLLCALAALTTALCLLVGCSGKTSLEIKTGAPLGPAETDEPTRTGTETPTAPGTETPTSETPSAPATGTPSEVPTEPATETPTETPTVPTTETPASGEKRVTFAAAGDNIIHEAVFTDAMALAAAQAVSGGYTDKYYFDSMYGGVRSFISAADAAFVNHECPMVGEEYGIAGYPYFNSPVESARALYSIGFDVVNVANNHMLDMDHSCTGLKNTVENMKKTPMLVIGGYTKEDYDNLRILTVNGVRIAFLSYTTCCNMETINPASPEMIIPWAAEADIRRQTKLARENADFLVVSMHWGIENSESVSDEQRRLASLLNECGTDVILGHHTHTVLPVEWVGSGEHKTLCYYSLGNFISTQHPIKNLVGIFASFDLVIGEDGKKSVENAAAVPHMTWYSTSRDALQVYMLGDVTDSLITTHGSQLRPENGGPFTLGDLKSFISRQISAEFLRY